jgi:hypothetical protein
VSEIEQLVHVVDPNAVGVEAAIPTLGELRAMVQAQRDTFVQDKAAGHPWSAERVQAMQEATTACYAEVLPIWTTGYAGWPSWIALNAAMKRDEPLLVDIRLNPWSDQPDYQREILEKRLGERYLSLPEWGNVNYKRGPIQIRDFQAGLRRLVALTPLRPVVLMCGCLSYGSCHRAEIARQLEVAGWASVQEYSLKTYGVATTATPPNKYGLRDYWQQKEHVAAYLAAVERREQEFRVAYP